MPSALTDGLAVQPTNTLPEQEAGAEGAVGSLVMASPWITWVCACCELLLIQVMVYLGAAVAVKLLPAAGELLLYVPLLSTAVTVQRYVVLADRPSSVVVVPFTSFVFKRGEWNNVSCGIGNRIPRQIHSRGCNIRNRQICWLN